MKPKQHYLPQCYQKGFTDSLNKVWVKFAGNPIPEHRNPDSIGWERDLYTGELGEKIETFFSKEVETDFAKFSRRVKKEQNKLSDVSGNELAVLSRFIATQTVRTLAHEQCIHEQAGRRVDRNTFNAVMLRKMKTMLDRWLENFPTFRFHTSLPLVDECFITGDHPVLAIQYKENPIWQSTNTPTLQISNLTQLLQNPTHGFWIALSPYICMSIQSPSGRKPQLPPERMEQKDVRQFNEFMRGQCKLFTLARDREPLV